MYNSHKNRTEFWNQYPLKAYYFDGVDNLEKELLAFMPGAKIARKKYLSQGIRMEYLNVNDNMRIRHTRNYYDSEKNCFIVSHRLVIELNPNIKHPELIIKSLEEKFCFKKSYNSI